MKFRRAYWAAAAREVGLEGCFKPARLPREILAGVSATDHNSLVQALLAGLRDLRSSATESDAFRTIILDLDPLFIKHGVATSLDSALSGTPAGAALGRMRAHADLLRTKRAQLSAYESPPAIEARQRAKRERRAAVQAQRRLDKQRRDLARRELLQKLSGMSPSERLSRFVSDPELIFDTVPAELVAIPDTDLADLNEADAIALISRIGERRGAWGRLRRLLKERLNPATPQ